MNELLFDIIDVILRNVFEDANNRNNHFASSKMKSTGKDTSWVTFIWSFIVAALVMWNDLKRALIWHCFAFCLNTLIIFSVISRWIPTPKMSWKPGPNSLLVNFRIYCCRNLQMESTYNWVLHLRPFAVIVTQPVTCVYTAGRIRRAGYDNGSLSCPFGSRAESEIIRHQIRTIIPLLQPIYPTSFFISYHHILLSLSYGSLEIDGVLQRGVSNQIIHLNTSAQEDAFTVTHNVPRQESPCDSKINRFVRLAVSNVVGFLAINTKDWAHNWVLMQSLLLMSFLISDKTALQP